MCIFANPVVEVRQTRIFVAPTVSGRQLTVYENYVDASGGSTKKEKEKVANIRKDARKQLENANAMILPVPFVVGSAVILLDFSKDAFSFDLLDSCFAKFAPPVSRGLFGSKGESKSLEVHSIGAYNMSVATNLGDLDRIDRSVFSVASNVRQLLGRQYGSGFGFVICAFDGCKKIEPHPIGYVHDRLPSGNLFVPCMHEHGHDTVGSVGEGYEMFDHVIYSVCTKKNTINGQDAGPSTGETLLQLIPLLDRGGINNADTNIDAVVAESPLLAFYLPRGEITLRRRLIKGRYANADLVFGIEDTEDSINERRRTVEANKQLVDAREWIRNARLKYEEDFITKRKEAEKRREDSQVFSYRK